MRVVLKQNLTRNFLETRAQEEKWKKREEIFRKKREELKLQKG